MSILEILILGFVILLGLTYITFYITKPFKNKDNTCAHCPYTRYCKKIKIKVK